MVAFARSAISAVAPEGSRRPRYRAGTSRGSLSSRLAGLTARRTRSRRTAAASRPSRLSWRCRHRWRRPRGTPPDRGRGPAPWLPSGPVNGTGRSSSAGRHRSFSPPAAASAAPSRGAGALGRGRLGRSVCELELTACAVGRPVEGVADGQGSVRFREDLHAPRSSPPSGAERRDYSGKVERSLSAVAATVDRVLEQCSNDLGVGVVEFDPDDPVQRNGGEVRDGRVGAFDVPDVDDDACRVVPGILDEPQAVVQGLDVRPWEELEPEPRPDAIGLRRELGELRRPVVGVPWGVVAVGGHLDVSRPERLGGGEECVADPVGLLPPGPVVPPVRDPLELEVHDAVVVEHRPDPREAVFLLGCRKVRRQEPEAGEPGCGRRLEPLAQGQRTAQVGTVGGSVACAAPASGQEAVLRSPRVARLAHHDFAPLLCEVRSRWRPLAGECGGDTRVSPPSRPQRWSSCDSSASSWPPAISVVSSSRVTSERFLSSTRRPSLRMMKWSPTRKAWCGLWVMKTTPRPASRAAALYLSTTPDCLTPSAAVGSSRMSTRAPKYTARAIATHCR